MDESDKELLQSEDARLLLDAEVDEEDVIDLLS